MRDVIQDQLNSYVVSDSGCWVWTKSVSMDGYGKLKRNGKTLRAHRVFYETYKGIITKGLQVCHTCDNPKCVNPDHLFLGTGKDNMQDMISKGRRPVHPSVSHPESILRGEKHPRYGKGMPEKAASALLLANKGRLLSIEHKEKLSPLTAEQVIAIRADTRSQATIAREYGVGQMTICRIKRRERWQHI